MPVDSIFLFGQFYPGDLGASYQRAFNAIGVRTHTLDLSVHRQHLGWWTRTRNPSPPHHSQWSHPIEVVAGIQSAIGGRHYPIRRACRPLPLSGNPASRNGAQPSTPGIRVACFFPDNPFPPHYGSRPETLPVAREADLCLIWSERLAEKLRAAGVRNPAFLPFAWDSQVFPYQGAQDQGTWPGVLFVGNWDRQREAFLEKLASHVPVRIYGISSYWGTRSMPFSKVRRCWQRTVLRGAEAARAIRESAICLNILRKQHIVDGEPDGLIMRHFEVPGAGGFLLSTRSGGATTLFPEGETAEYFSGLPECVEKIRSYLANDSARRNLVERAHAAVAAHHQYTDRAQQILRLLDADSRTNE